MFNNPTVKDAQGNVIDNKFEALNKYGKNLTQLARDQKIEPIIGRTKELNSLIQVLARRRKNNAVITGEPGVGKSALVELLATRVASGDVPANLKNVELYELSLTALVAGAQYRGEFEERLQQVITEVTESNGGIILFVDEAHMLLGNDDNMNAANILKPALARGELRMIGATTRQEYNKYFEKDAALSRRFTVVACEEPSVEDTISILFGIKSKLESHHGVTIRDSALIAAAQLTERFIPNRFQPDKSIDIIDEACAAIRVQLDSKPTIIDNLEREILTKNVEKTALTQEHARISKQTHKNTPAMLEQLQNRLKQVQDDLNTLQLKLAPLEEQYKQQYGKNKELQAAKLKLEEISNKIELSQRAKDFAKVVDLKYAQSDIQAKISRLEKEIKQAALNNTESATALISDTVGPEQVAEVCSKFTGIPLGKLTQSEKNRYLHLNDELSARVVGQSVAVKAVSNAVCRSKAGFSNPHQPIASFLFCGSTGCGKTELAKGLANVLFDTDRALIRFDMSEYSDKHSVSKLIGAPAGYIGYDAGGQLTEAVRRKPYCVILFDECEKAHPDVYNTLLQVLDDGVLTDSKGRRVDFCNTIIIFTSNLGSQYLMEKNVDYSNPDVMKSVKSKVLTSIKSYFRPEFLNRLSELVLFETLTNKHMFEIIKITMRELTARMKDHDIRVEFENDAAITAFIKATHDPQYGARGIKRALDRSIVTHLSREILRGTLKPHTLVKVNVNDGSVSATRGIGFTTIASANSGMFTYQYIPFSQAGIKYGTVGRPKSLGVGDKDENKYNDMSDDEEMSD